MIHTVIEFEKIRQMKSQFEHLSAELARAYEDVDPSVAEKEMAEAIQAGKKRKTIIESCSG